MEYNFILYDYALLKLYRTQKTENQNRMKYLSRENTFWDFQILCKKVQTYSTRSGKNRKTIYQKIKKCFYTRQKK